jgi:hypothetical protein
VVDRGVVRDLQDPGGERDPPRLVPVERRQQLGEDVLRDVLGLVLVAHDRADVAVDVVGVAQVEEAERVRVAAARPRDRAEGERLGRGRAVERPPPLEATLTVLRLDRIGCAPDGAGGAQHPVVPSITAVLAVPRSGRSVSFAAQRPN